MEVRELLSEYDFPGDDTPIVAGSAFQALEEAKAGQSGEWSEKIYQLMAEVDAYIPTPERSTDKDYLMPVEDVFSIAGRGTVVTGAINQGTVKLGDTIEIVGLKETQTTTVTGIEMFRKEMDYAEAGDNAGILLRGIKKEDVQRGQVLVKPGSITPHTKFKGEVYILSKEEGGRHTPFFSGYRPQFYVRTTDVTGSVELPAGTEMVMPGDNVELTVSLVAPIALEKGTKFAIREGGRTVGAGVVAEIIEQGDDSWVTVQALKSDQNVRSVVILTTLLTKIQKLLLKRWRLKNIVQDQKNIQFIRKLNQSRKTFLTPYFRSVAPMVERRIPNPTVGGSSPSWPATKFFQKQFRLFLKEFQAQYGSRL
eukprot:TRINITY_DN29761_c0_g1_i1.p1 TRINITY_DN29761_c0_g1~~TRINITY_DN29761_c0_g1_i1.p1  ORF type:complete len:405 (+),score=-13.17 TRINITY_DN29761_c0_g1_i1:119-1216(+)